MRLREFKNTTSRLTLKQAGGSAKSRGETCRLRPRQQIGTVTIGRREVGIPSILHGLTIRENVSSILDQFRLTEINFTTTDEKCEQNTHLNSMYRCAQCLTTYTEQNDHISSREHAWLNSAQAQGCTHWCLKTIVIHVLCLVPYRTWHWPPAQVLSSLFFPTISPSHPSPLAHVPCLHCEDPRQSDRSTQIPSLPVVRCDKKVRPRFWTKSQKI